MNVNYCVLLDCSCGEWGPCVSLTQGPPGTGKTYHAAQIVAEKRRRKTVPGKVKSCLSVECFSQKWVKSYCSQCIVLNTNRTQCELKAGLEWRKFVWLCPIETCTSAWFLTTIPSVSSVIVQPLIQTANDDIGAGCAPAAVVERQCPTAGDSADAETGRLDYAGIGHQVGLGWQAGAEASVAGAVTRSL